MADIQQLKQNGISYTPAIKLTHGGAEIDVLSQLNKSYNYGDFTQTITAEKITLSCNSGNPTTGASGTVQISLDAMDGANAGLYTKALADEKLNIPGYAPGTTEVLRLPYFFETVVDSGKVTVKAHTVKLDNAETKVDEVFTLDVLPMDYEHNKAGLYTKELADLKASVGALDAEIETRITQDTQLQNNIDAEKERAETEEAKMIKLLGNEPFSGEPYHIPFNINPLVQDATQISTTFNTITLDNNKTVVTYPIAIPSADVENNKAGLYNKVLAEKKVDRTTRDAQNATNTIDNQPGQNGCVMQTTLSDGSTIISFNTASENGADGILGQIYAKNYVTGQGMRLNFTKAGAYYGVGASTPIDEAHEIATKGDITAGTGDFIKLLGDEAVSGQPYNFTYYYEVTPDIDKIVAKAYTITLDNNKTLKDFSLDVPAMDGTNAGLYTKALADAKLNVLPKEPFSGIDYRFPFHIETPVQNADSITAQFHTLVINDGVTRDTYTITIPAANISEDKAGLYTKAMDDAKVDKQEGYALSKITLNNTGNQAPSFYAPTTVGSAGQFFGSNGTTTGWQSISAVQKFMGQKETLAEIQALTGMAIGDTWLCKADNHNYSYNGTEWVDIGNNIDLTGYQLKKIGTATTDAGKIVSVSADGEMVVESGDFGGNNALMYIVGGVPTASNVNLGGESKPIYLDKGEFKEGKALGGASQKGVATAISSSSTDDDLATGKAVYGYAVQKNSPLSSVGTKCKITFDSKGLVTAGADLAASDIPSLASNKITAMTDYSKASSEATISTSDSLNVAIGKLEYSVSQRIAKSSLLEEIKSTSTKEQCPSAKAVWDLTVGAASKTTMTGYTIATASSPIATTDTLNTAIAKLEYRLKQLENANLVRYS